MLKKVLSLERFIGMRDARPSRPFQKSSNLQALPEAFSQAILKNQHLGKRGSLEFCQLGEGDPLKA